MQGAVRFVFRRHLSAFLGLFYLILIPAYAVLYAQQDQGFYHSTAKHQAGLAADALALEERLTRALVEQHGVSNNGSTSWESPTYTMDLATDATVSDLMPSGSGAVTFDVDMDPPPEGIAKSDIDMTLDTVYAFREDRRWRPKSTGLNQTPLCSAPPTGGPRSTGAICPIH